MYPDCRRYESVIHKTHPDLKVYSCATFPGYAYTAWGFSE